MVSRPPLYRMQHLHDQLQRGTYPNCQKMGLELEVSYKTIQRDIDFMRDQLGLPIAYDPNQYGFHYTEKVTHFPTVQATEGELLALFVAQKALTQYKGTGFEEPLHNAFRKLTEGLTDRVDFHLDELGAHYSFRSVGTPVSDLYLFNTLGNCVMKSLEITFEYRKLEGQTWERRHVQPYHLACIDNQWYLFAHDHARDQIRTFALPRMRNVETNNVKFTRPEGFSPAELLSQSFGVFSGNAHHKVRIHFDSFAAQLVREKVWHPSQTIKEKKNGTLELSMTLGSLHEITRWIMSWHHHAKVLGPESLRKSIHDSIQKMASYYEKAPSRNR